MTDLPDRSGPSAPSEAVDAVLRRALSYAETDDWDEMASVLGEALEGQPDDPFLLCWLGVAEREQGLDGSAYEHFKRALALAPTDPVLLTTAGTAVAAFDDPEAEPALRTAALLAPDRADTRWRYGAYLSREGMLDDAIRELEAAASLAPDDPVVHVETGVARALRGELPASEASFETALALDPTDGWTMILLGLVRVTDGQVADAVAVLEEGARQRPDDMEAQMLASLALISEGWEDRGTEMLERARLVSEESGIEEIYDRIDEGSDAALRLLTERMAPSALRSRLMQRP